VLVLVVIVGFITTLGIVQTGQLGMGLGITAGFLGAFGLLIGIAMLLTKMVRRFFPTSWQYVWRQGLANLYRPDNQTSILMLSLGLGTFLIATLYIVQHALLAQIALSGGNNRPNLVLVDIQSDQLNGVSKLVKSHGLPLIHRAPVATMSLAKIKGFTPEAYRDSVDVSRWALFREYRSTYRDDLFDSERLVSGKWTVGSWDGVEPVPVSFEEDIAQTLHITLGDTVVFDVQGVSITTVVRSLREVDWQRIQPNFFVVFPPGVLELAPQFHVFTTRVNSAEQSARLQRELVVQFPNVSAVDLGLILQTVDEVLSQVGFVVRFMALFSVFTGLLVLISAVTTSRYQRIQESVLLRTLGAARQQIRRILFLEYVFLGALSALTGLLLSVGGAWALTFFVFEIDFSLPLLALSAVFLIVTILTVVVGMVNSRGIATRPPLEILRSEG
jgi:putative ABC transport system permease protein